MSTPTTNRQLRLAQRPTSASVGPANFEMVETDRPEPGPGEFVVRNCWLSLDPASRGWLVGREEVVDGLAGAPAALQRLFDGANHGKLVVRVSEEVAA